MKQEAFYTKIIGNNTLELKISGVETEGDLKAFRTWAKENHELAKKNYEDNNQERGKSLVDISDLHKIHHEMVKVLTNLIRENEEYTDKVATFGGNPFVVMAQDTVVSLSGTKQEFKAFTDREEAEVWLYS